ncbi:MAG: hypothetical protein DK305_000378 [Chloroflexi bacterium]|jgi:hypothetical protein|nr:MAG: hypothetical protein DK305_000378 [Chloroflexota bacterium]|tara:strand:- start:2517 stop:3185 length:669 start_codon:yes stop_codon:yes gene_type:complete
MNIKDIPAELNPNEGLEIFTKLINNNVSLEKAILTIIGRWAVKEEIVDNVNYQYWINDEVFNWLFLASRILDASKDLIEIDLSLSFLFNTYILPGGDQTILTRAFPPYKYKAHLNFLYGVLLEESIIIVNDMQGNKEALSGLTKNFKNDSTYLILYGYTYDEFIRLYEYENKLHITQFNSLNDYYNFLYWSWQYRIKNSTPEKIAYDTHTGISYLWNLKDKK